MRKTAKLNIGTTGAATGQLDLIVYAPSLILMTHHFSALGDGCYNVSFVDGRLEIIAVSIKDQKVFQFGKFKIEMYAEIVHSSRVTYNVIRKIGEVIETVYICKNQHTAKILSKLEFLLV